jgi:hypothetical protein
MRRRIHLNIYTICLVAFGFSQSSFAQSSFQEILNNGSTDKRINIVFLSEGYTSAQLPQYRTDASNNLNALLNTSPYSAYRNYFNAFLISIESIESGSDDPDSNIYRNTFFNSKYSSGRVITLDAAGERRVDSLLQVHIPEYDIVIIIVNDTQYGGSGGSLAIASVNSNSAEIVIHELGHSLAKLGDEYSTSYPGYPDTEEPNTTRDTIRTNIKWRTWILDSTPIPTLDQYTSVIGLFKGAHYHTTGWYRPKYDCKMRTLGVPFCEVCSETLVKSFYTLIRPIESHSPTSSMISSQDSQFTIVPMRPSSNNLSIQWYINGIQKSGATSSTFNVSGSELSIGDTVKVVVCDTTWLVRNDSGRLLRDSISWVRVSAVPVELTSFTATRCSTNVELTWATATEVNNYGFEIERRVISASSNQWSRVAFVQGAGTSSSPRDYFYSDKNLAVGRYAYRLKQIDNDGLFKYSNSIEVSIETPNTFSLEQNYPNPFNPTTVISFSVGTYSYTSLRVYDLLGREVATLVSETLSAGTYSRQWNADGMPSGMYLYRLSAVPAARRDRVPTNSRDGQSEKYSETKKLLLLK